MTSIIVNWAALIWPRRRHRVAMRRIIRVVCHWPQRLSVSTVNSRLPLLRVQRSATALGWQSPSVAKMWVRSVGWYEGLRLGRDWCEDTLLLEALAVGTTTVIGCFEARATNLQLISTTRKTLKLASTYLAPSTISTRDCRSLPRSRLTLITHVRLSHCSRVRGPVGGIHVVGRYGVSHIWMALLGWR